MSPCSRISYSQEVLAMDNEAHSTAAHAGILPAGRAIRDVQHTTCCIVGAGAAGSVLAFILARQGVPVLLLEKHRDFAASPLSTSVI
jgi:NADPH-dependent 2,4-dienoyl-CoA reductase/sulfur reductase-like enzyme